MSEVLNSLSNALAGLVESAGAYVVRVEGRNRLPASGVVYRGDGVIVTAHHVVERDDNLRVGLPNGESAAAQLVGRDPSTDLAVLRVEGAQWNAPQWVDAADLRVGNLALALGRPGRGVQAVLGLVTALGGPYRTGGGGEVEGDALLGADGLLSAVRQQLLGDGPPQPVGDLAYRAMLRMDALPPVWRANEVTVWMGTDLHLVHYPVRAGAALNVVAILRHAAPRAPAGRDDDAVPSGELARALGSLGIVCAPLRELVALLAPLGAP